MKAKYFSLIVKQTEGTGTDYWPTDHPPPDQTSRICIRRQSAVKVETVSQLRCSEAATNFAIYRPSFGPSATRPRFGFNVPLFD